MKTNKLKTKPKIKILCEGQTEFFYFHWINGEIQKACEIMGLERDKIIYPTFEYEHLYKQIVVEPDNYEGCSKIYNKLIDIFDLEEENDQIEQKQFEEFDYLFVVIDSDIKDKNGSKKYWQEYLEIKKRIQEAKLDNVFFYEIHPCFEVWFLLHFTHIIPMTNDNDICNKLRSKEYLRYYNKTADIDKKGSRLDPKFYEKILNKFDIAMKNAKICTPEITFTNFFIKLNEIATKNAN